MKHDVRVVEGAQQNFLGAIAIHKHCFRCGKDMFDGDFYLNVREECLQMTIWDCIEDGST